MRNRILIAGLLLLIGCKSAPIITHPVKFADIDPLEFLTHLQSHEMTECHYVERVPGGWVKEKHLPRLFKLLDSGKRCALPDFFASSPHEDHGEGSTVGRESAFMIMNFRGKDYPAPLGSRVSNEEKVTLRAWWRQYRKDNE